MTISLFYAPAPTPADSNGLPNNWLMDKTRYNFPGLTGTQSGADVATGGAIAKLQELEVAQVTITFAEFRASSAMDKWLDLPTRWLQELFPADELLAQRLGLALEQVQVEMVPGEDRADPAAAPIYRIGLSMTP
ncbi:MAG: hypothetical protein R2932_42610 [Caldilineaceae bacterium]